MLNETNTMSRIRKPAHRVWWSVFKWIILLASFAFLAWKLLTFNQYDEFVEQWGQMPLSHFWWLVSVFLFLPLNWFLEAVKWQKLVSKVQNTSIINSLKGVLAGISTGFFTPNRVGELVGRVMFLDADNRKSGITLCILNSLTQNIILVLCGVPAGVLFFFSATGKMKTNLTGFLALLIICLLIFGLIYFALPTLTRQFGKSRFSSAIKPYTDCLTEYNSRDLLLILFISLCRYIVFCTQFYFMLQFFNVELTLWQALIAIPTTYLFITFTPSLAFTDAAVRSSYAVLVIGVFSNQVVDVALASMLIWAINFIIPMLAGSVVLARKRL